MKTIMSVCIGLIAVVLVGFAFVFDRKQKQLDALQEQVATLVEANAQLGQFASAEDAVSYRNLLTYEQEFVTLDDKVITNVANVILAKKTPLCVETILQEYKGNKEIYDNVSPPDIPKETTKDSVIPQLPTTKEPLQTSIRSKDTLIEGKKLKVVEKTEVYDE